MFGISSNMILLVIASLFSCPVFGKPIIGGQLSDIQLHPWLVSIQKLGYHWCGGSIITNSVILTAAHCVADVSLDSFIVRVGSSRTDSGGTWHRVVATKTHENYTVSSGAVKLTNDVGLIKVSPPLRFDSRVSGVELAAEGHKVRPGTRVSVAGWGSEVHGGWSTYDLKSTNLRITDSGDCARAYGDETGTQMSSNNLICAFQSGGDTCSGDSGGPIVDGNVQVGIVSWGSVCLDFHHPGVYTEVARYRDWIDVHSEKLEFLVGTEQPSDSFFSQMFSSIKSWFD